MTPEMRVCTGTMALVAAFTRLAVTIQVTQSTISGNSDLTGATGTGDFSFGFDNGGGCRTFVRRQPTLNLDLWHSSVMLPAD